MIREVCCGSLAAVRSAAERGADRAELCTALEVGGVTPSAGMIRQAVQYGIPVNVLIRLRSGDFIYNKVEVDAMCDDCRMAIHQGANAVVIGALTPEGDIDIPACRRMIDAANEAYEQECQALGDKATRRRPEITFHRAFDECRDPFLALEQIIQMGCHRILTSGQKPTAPEGADLLKQLVERAAGRIIILAGSGVTPDNCEALVQSTGVSEVHGSRL